MSEIPEDPRYVIGYQREQWNYWQGRAELAEARIRALEAALRDLLSYTFETTVPPTIIDKARAALTEPTPPAGGQHG